MQSFAQHSVQHDAVEADPLAQWVDHYGNKPRKGADILVQCLEREAVSTIFAYPGGASLEIHQALTRSSAIRNILCRHEQVRILLFVEGSFGFDLRMVTL